MTEKIRQIHEASRGTYGASRVHAELRLEHDVRVGRKRVARLMRAAGIAGVRPRKSRKTTIRIPGVTPACDLVERRFRPDRPNVLWVADITYLRTGERWLYLAAVQDAFSRQIVGWSMANQMRATLVIDALQMALGRRRPEAGVIHHSDQGSQYVSLAFGRAAAQAGIAVSIGLPRRRLRQRSRRDVLRDPQKGARAPPHLADPARPAVRRVRIHRGVLQPPAPPLHARDAAPRRLRATTTLAARWLRSIAGTTTINLFRCHANRGRSRCRRRRAPCRDRSCASVRRATLLRVVRSGDQISHSRSYSSPREADAASCRWGPAPGSLEAGPGFARGGSGSSVCT